MNEREFEILLDKCLQDLSQGEELAAILKDHPEQAWRLEPLLQAASVVQTLPKPEASREAVLRGRNHLLRAANLLPLESHILKNGTDRAKSRYSERWYERLIHLLVGKENIEMKLIPRLAIYLLITILVAGFFTVNASASSLPGDVLYNLKLSWEEIQKALAFSADTKLKLEQEFELERLSEVEALLGQGRVEDVEFYGVIDSMDSPVWNISGISVRVDGSTELKGQLEVGTLVKVEALTQEDGSLLAIEIYPANLDGSDDSALTEDGSQTPEVEDEFETETQEAEDEDETPEPEESETPEDELSETEDESESVDDDSTPEPEKTQKPDDHSNGGDDDDEKDDD